jgi:AAA+ superfamily predicted ATPase
MDDFIKVSFDDQTSKKADAEYNAWIGHSSHQQVDSDTFFSSKLQELYPDHSLVVTADWKLDLLQFPDALTALIPGKKFLSHAVFVPFARRTGHAGVVAKDVFYGVFRLAWKDYEYTVYIVQWPQGYGYQKQHFILREGKDEGPTRQLLFAAGAWATELREEILVFQQGWIKDHSLWLEVQKANWEDVILDDKFKTAIQGDITGFFGSREIYKELAIPWKRGLIFYGPAGNGKTISLKAAMKGNPHPTLYVRSFQWWGGDEAAMAMIFGKAREMSPCMLVIEDLDSHINDRNRSFFLNQLDGLDDNDGLLLVGTTNHLDRLDGSISNRPSRFDRKYLFDAPNLSERRQYAVYWQSKLKKNPDIEFPDSLLDVIAESTNGFSFAYLKEVFVSTLMLKAGNPKLGSFSEVLQVQIKALKKQLEGNQGTIAREVAPAANGQASLIQGFQNMSLERAHPEIPQSHSQFQSGADGPFVSSTYYGGRLTRPSPRQSTNNAPWRRANPGTSSDVPVWYETTASPWGDEMPGTSNASGPFVTGQSHPGAGGSQVPGAWDCRPQGSSFGRWP